MSEHHTELIELVPGVNWIQVLAPIGPSKAQVEDFNSAAISNAEDRELLFAARAKSDAIVTTKKTALAENYRASRFAPIFVIDRTGLAPKFEPVPADEVRQGIHLITSIEDVPGQLRVAEPRILLESGRSYAAAIAKAGLLKRLILVVPTLDAQIGTDTLDSTLKALRLESFAVRTVFRGSQNILFVLDAAP